METIKLHLTLGVSHYGVLSDDGVWTPMICNEFVSDCLDGMPLTITVWGVPSKAGNIVIIEPDSDTQHKERWDFLGLGWAWKWVGKDSTKPLFPKLGGMLTPGRYNVYISEGWV